MVRVIFYSNGHLYLVDSSRLVGSDLWRRAASSGDARPVNEASERLFVPKRSADLDGDDVIELLAG